MRARGGSNGPGRPIILAARNEAAMPDRKFNGLIGRASPIRLHTLVRAAHDGAYRGLCSAMRRQGVTPGG